MDDSAILSTIEDERCLIAAPFASSRSQELMRECATEVEPGHFMLGTHQLLWQAMLATTDHGEDVTVPSVRNYLPETKRAEALDELAHILNGGYVTPDDASALWYAREVARSARRRRLAAPIARALKRIEKGTEPPDIIHTDLLHDLPELDAPKGGARRIVEAIDQEYLNTRLHDPGKILGIPTGLKELDWMVDGLVGGRFYVLAAETSIGKSIFVHDMTRSLALQKRKVLICSTEMAATDVAHRLIWLEAGIDPLSWREQRGYTSQQRSAVQEAIQAVSGWEVSILDEGNLTLAHVLREVRHLRPDVVFIDHLDMMVTVKERQSRKDELREITTGLKDMAHDLRLPIVGVSHVNRPTKDGAGMGLHRLMESSTKEKDANVVMFLEPCDGDGNVIERRAFQGKIQRDGWAYVRLQVEKNRHGRTGALLLRVRWDKGGRFETA